MPHVIDSLEGIEDCLQQVLSAKFRSCW